MAPREEGRWRRDGRSLPTVSGRSPRCQARGPPRPCSNGRVAASTLDDLLSRHPWTPIRNCPGRWVLRGSRPDLGVREMVGQEVSVAEYEVASTPDRVLVARFADGGVLTFRKPDGTHVHTLNTVAGLQRRLARLGIDLADE